MPSTKTKQKTVSSKSKKATASSSGPEVITPLVIKKYGNRRLYNTENKSYITLEDVTVLIKNGRQVQIIDSKNGEDLTQMVLIQIILDTQKGSKHPLFSNELLHQLIENRQDMIHEFFQSYVPHLLDQYSQFNEQWQENWNNWSQQQWQSASQLFSPTQIPLFPFAPAMSKLNQWPAKTMTQTMHSTMDQVEAFVEQAKKWSPYGGPANETGSPEAAQTVSVEELNALKNQLKDIEKRLNKTS